MKYIGIYIDISVDLQMINSLTTLSHKFVHFSQFDVSYGIYSLNMKFVYNITNFT